MPITMALLVLFLRLLEGRKMSYTIYPVLGFLGLLLAGGVTLIADAGIRLVHDLRRKMCGTC
jgi:hypothetical protein